MSDSFLQDLAETGYNLRSFEVENEILRLEAICGIVLLHYSISQGNINDVCNILKLGVSANVIHKGFSPLHLAVSLGNARLIKILLEMGADIEEKVRHKQSLLELAVSKGHADAVDTLITEGLCPDENDVSLIFMAAEKNYVDVADVLLDYCENSLLVHMAVDKSCESSIRCFAALGLDLDEVDDDLETPIYKAAKAGNLPIIKVLIDEGADLLTKDSKGHSLLHIAVMEGNLLAVRTLLDAGIDINIKGGWWEITPLHTAIQHGKLNIVQYLVQNKADVNAKSSDGRTPLDLAPSYYLDACARLLK